MLLLWLSVAFLAQKQPRGYYNTSTAELPHSLFLFTKPFSIPADWASRTGFHTEPQGGAPPSQASSPLQAESLLVPAEFLERTAAFLLTWSLNGDLHICNIFLVGEHLDALGRV